MSKNAAAPGPYSRTRRRFPRYALDVRLTAQVFRAGTSVSFWGRSNELGQDGIGGTLTGELDVGEVVSLEFALPVRVQPLRLRAVVRYRHGLRHGFEFLTVNTEQREDIQRACEMLSCIV